ncbi:MAG: hypothetical protein GYA34_03065 [Chloroflexi bacterium]|nr:hypothetical protein [Chloroflexota bacterium]
MKTHKDEVMYDFEIIKGHFLQPAWWKVFKIFFNWRYYRLCILLGLGKVSGVFIIILPSFSLP